MKGLWLENQSISIRHNIPEPNLAKDEAKVQVDLVGICNTDLELVRGYYPFTGIPGHEFVGRIAECTEPSRIGQRVVGEINAACGVCSFCQRGMPRHCSARTVLGIVGRWGAFGEYLTLPLQNLLEVPDEIPTEAAVFTEPVAAACEIIEQLNPEPGLRTLVVGDGKLGLLIAQVLQHHGLKVHVLGRNQRKAAIAQQLGLAWGTHDTYGSQTFPLVIECTGNQDGFSIAQSLIEPQGTLVLKSTYADKLQIDMAPIVVNEITLVGSRCGPFPMALDLLKEKAVDVAPMIEGTYNLDDGVEAFEKAAQPGILKVLVQTT